MDLFFDEDDLNEFYQQRRRMRRQEGDGEERNDEGDNEHLDQGREEEGVRSQDEQVSQQSLICYILEIGCDSSKG